MRPITGTYFCLVNKEIVRLPKSIVIKMIVKVKVVTNLNRA